MSEEKEVVEGIQTDVDDMLGEMLGGKEEEEKVEDETSDDTDTDDEGSADEGEEGEEEGAKDKEEEKDEDEEADAEVGGEKEGESDEDEGAEEDAEGEDKDTLIASLRKSLADRDGGEEEEEVKEEGGGEEEEFSLLDGQDLEQVLDDPAKFETMMRSGYERYGNLLMKKFLTSIPQVVMHQVRQQSVIRSAVDAFYGENKDLQDYKKLVGATINEVVAENPDWKMDKVFNDAAVRTRKVLGLKKVAEGSKGKKKGNPSFAKPKGKSGKSGVKSKPSKLQTDIDSLLVEQ
jgi:hypothetical protein